MEFDGSHLLTSFTMLILMRFPSLVLFFFFLVSDFYYFAKSFGLHTMNESKQNKDDFNTKAKDK